MDELEELAPQTDRRDEQLIVFALLAVAGQVVEDFGDVAAQRVIGGEQTNILI